MSGVLRAVLVLLAAMGGGILGFFVGWVLAQTVVVGDLTQQSVEIGGQTWFEGESSGSELGDGGVRGILGVLVVLACIGGCAALAGWLAASRLGGGHGLLLALAGALPGAVMALIIPPLGFILLLVGPPFALLRAARPA